MDITTTADFKGYAGGRSGPYTARILTLGQPSSFRPVRPGAHCTLLQAELALSWRRKAL